MVCGTFADADGEHLILLREEALDLVAQLLAAGKTLVGVNIVFDMAVVVANRPSLMVPVFRAFEQGRILSCDIIERLRKIARGMNKFDYVHKRKPRYSLAELVEEYLGEYVSGKKGQDAWRLRYKELDGVPLEDWPVEARDYAVDDARYTARVFLKQQEALKSDALMAQTMVDLRRQQMDAFGLYMMRVWGFRADALATDMLDKELHDHVDGELEFLLSVGLYKEKLTKKRATGIIERKLSKNMKMLEERVKLAYELKDEPLPMTEGGKGEVKKPKPKTDAETLIASLDPELRRLADIMGDKKLMDTYVPILRGGTKWPINPYYNILVDSGRTSASNPNIQNQPRKGGVRECFVPSPGYVYVGCDYHTAELRTLAQYCLSVLGVSEMAEAFKHTEKYPHGKDLHLVMAAALLNIPYDEAEARKKTKVVKEARQLSKVLNFGFPGGLGAQKFIDFAWKSYAMKLAPTNAEAIEVARRLKKQWIAAFPEMQLFFNSINAQLSGAEGFTAIALNSNRLRGNVGYCDGCNCVDYETEALTRRGWVRGEDLTTEDVVLTLNPSTQVYEWQHPTEVSHFPDYKGPVVQYNTRNFSAVTTPDHRWLAEKKGGGSTYVTDSLRFSSCSGDTLVRTGMYLGEDSYRPEFVRLVGWVLTDGSYRKDTPGSSTVRIYQSATANPDKVQAIRETLAALGLPVYEGTSRDLVVFNFAGPVAQHLRALFPERALTPQFVQTLSASSAETLIDTLVSGDGHRTRHSAGETRHFGTSSETQASSFQMLCVLAGYSCAMSKRDNSAYGPHVSKKHGLTVRSSSKPYYTCVVLVRKRTQILKQHKQVLRQGTGVWCPTVPNGFFVARRAGTTYVTGNTMFQGLAADGAKMAVWAVVKESWTGWTWNEEIPDTAELGTSPLLGYRPNGFIHDEILGESPLPLFRQHAARLAIVMKEAMGWFVTDIPVEADAHAMRRWWKDAEPRYDKDGQLLIWSPEDPYEKLKGKAPTHTLLEKWWNDDDVAAVEAEFPPDPEKKEPTWTALFRAYMLDQLAQYRTGEEEMPA